MSNEENEIINILRQIETEELVRVVRCKDCRYGQKCVDGKTTFQCFKWNSGEFGELHEQDWYCADGERELNA